MVTKTSVTTMLTKKQQIGTVLQITRKYPTNTPRVFRVETTWKRPFPRRFNVKYTWCVCRVSSIHQLLEMLNSSK